MLAKSVNRHMALFIRDLFSVMDRGVVFRIIDSVLFAMAPVGADDDLALVELKLDFLRVITGASARLIVVVFSQLLSQSTSIGSR